MRRRDGACCVSLTTWPEHLAISTLKQRQQDADCAGGGRGFRPVAFPAAFPKGYGGMKKVRAWMEDFHRLPYVSPYEDCSRIDPESDLMEKRVVGVLHEVLSLTMHKKTKRNYLRCLREEMSLPHRFTRVFTRGERNFHNNKLAKICDMNVHLPVERELCPFNLAPVTLLRYRWFLVALSQLH